MYPLEHTLQCDDCWQTKKKNILHYNAFAKIYDLQYKEEQMRKYKAGLKAPYTPKESWALDIGSGTGLLIEFADQNSNIICIDCSKNMLKQAKHKCSNKQTFVCADADNLPFREQTFHTIFSFTVLQNMPNPEKTIVEMLRVAKQGSEIVLSVTKKAFNTTSFLHLFTGKKVDMFKFIDEESLKDYILISKCND